MDARQGSFISRGSGHGLVVLLLWCLAVCVWQPGLAEDSTFVYAVQISAMVQSSPPQITLSWEPDPYGAAAYTIYRKFRDDLSWGAPIATLPGSDGSYVDANVAVGTAYEYQIVKTATLGYTGYGYIYSGIEAPMIDHRGTVLLIVAGESVIGLDSELARLQSDLTGDGWTVLRHDVSSNDTPESVHTYVQGAYWSNPDDVNALFLLGHVPILQSGYLDYDGHGARPMPADAFYGDVQNDWPTAPGSSPSYLPSYVPLMIGRVDMANMPGVGAAVPWPSETQLLRQYLDKDHNWRHALVSAPRRALMGNRRGDEGGLAVAASGYRSFEPLVGPGNLVEANTQDVAPASQRWISYLAGGSYLWAYGCGAGQDTVISELGTHGTYSELWSTDVVGLNAQAVFVMVFGSHLGNWDHSDNIMRSVLATPGIGLTCCMSGEPHWFFHHMGLGETIGYSTRLSLNNSTLYNSQINSYTQAVYIALMGDPTLRMEPVPTPGQLTASASANQVALNWAPSLAQVAGYHVYRAASADGPFTRLTATPAPGITFTDSPPVSGTYTYMVRAVTLQVNPSGSYFDPSQGVFATVTVTEPPPPITVIPSWASGQLVLTWNTIAGALYHVEATSNPGVNPWQEVSGALEAAGSQLSWSDPANGQYARRFYRVASP